MNVAVVNIASQHSKGMSMCLHAPTSGLDQLLKVCQWSGCLMKTLLIIGITDDVKPGACAQT